MKVLLIDAQVVITSSVVFRDGLAVLGNGVEIPEEKIISITEEDVNDE